jgi:hypothetical protein
VVSADRAWARRETTRHCTRRRLRSQATGALRSSGVWRLRPRPNPRTLRPPTQPVSPISGCCRSRAKSPRRFPSIVNVRTVVVRSGIASFRTAAFRVPIASAVKAIRANGGKSDGTREARTDAVPHLLADTSVERGCFSVETKVVSIQRPKTAAACPGRQGNSSRRPREASDRSAPAPGIQRQEPVGLVRVANLQET